MKKVTKKVLKGFLSTTLALSMVLSSTSVADARTYYGKYNKEVVAPIIVDRMREAHGDALDNSVFVNASFGDDSNTNIYDYDGDGKKETVKVSATWEDGYVNGAKITMNGKDSGFWVDYYGDICFYAMELNGEPIGFIQYSDMAGEDGGIWICKIENDRIIPIDAREGGGNLNLNGYVATDKFSGKDYIYVERIEKLKKKAYPKKYKKYKNKKGVSVVKYTYEKLLIEGDSLVFKGKDVSYTVGKND